MQLMLEHCPASPTLGTNAQAHLLVMSLIIVKKGNCLSHLLRGCILTRELFSFMPCSLTTLG